MAYEMARECCGSFEEEDPTPEQIKLNLDMMRKAAFSGGEYKRHYSEELRLDMPKEIGVTQDKPKRSTVPGKREKSDAELAKVKAELDAKARGAKYGTAKAVEKKPPSRSQSSRVVEKSQKVKRKVDGITTDEVMEDAESRKREFNSEIYQKAKALADTLPRGITVRPSGKWVSRATLIFSYLSLCPH